jgi:esterase/lipase superfamily enzyme
MFRKVRASVRTATDGRQVPAYISALSGEPLYLAGSSLAAGPRPEPEPGGGDVAGAYEAERSANIRRGPATDAQRVTTVARGAPLRVIGRAEGRDWYEVETAEGVRGFIYGQLIRRTPLPAPILPYVTPEPSDESAARPARPVAPAPPVETAAAPVVRPGDGKLVRVFYGTDRVNAGTAAAPRFSGARARQLTLGTVVVRIPPEHQLGLVERPWSFSVFGQNIVDLPEDPERHFTIYRIAVSDGERFVDDLRQVVSVSRSYQHQAFVFVHGYNVSFEAAAFRTAQIAHDLNFDGAPIFYSWPSRGDLTDYEYDQNSASQARPFLKEFLELVRRRSGADVVHLIAHSMGTGPLLEVLAELKGADDAATPLFNEIVLAAPDIDVDVFYYLAKRVQGVAKGITMYVSSADRAMQAAREYARGVPRAGDVPQTGPVIEFGIDTIDATAISTGFFGLNHSDYAENRILLNDIGLLLRAGLRPPSARNLTLVRVPVRDGYYWKYPD